MTGVATPPGRVSGMTSPGTGGPVPRDPRRERLVAVLVLGVAVVLLVSSVTWFASDRQGVGVGQLVLALCLLAVGAVLHRRAGRR